MSGVERIIKVKMAENGLNMQNVIERFPIPISRYTLRTRFEKPQSMTLGELKGFIKLFCLSPAETLNLLNEVHIDG